MEGTLLTAFYPIKDRGKLIGGVGLGFTLNHIAADVSSARWRLMLIALLFGALGASATAAAANRTVKQVELVLDHVERLGRGDLQSRCELTTDDEIGRLAAATNKTAEDLKTAQDADRARAEEQLASSDEMRKKVDVLLDVVRRVGQGDSPGRPDRRQRRDRAAGRERSAPDRTSSPATCPTSPATRRRWRRRRRS